jgi:hypothetical protein
VLRTPSTTFRGQTRGLRIEKLFHGRDERVRITRIHGRRGIASDFGQ